ncbi:transcriptional regulator [Escherichia coli]|uniref:Mor transcription activator family protein n=1 Tax=Escherichia coli TaxID=562 RepID=UPI00053B78D2|nr:Mor transcription activator family protein [Escherichia coli]HDQ6665690.1 transcriptional regulator [Escherichia coli O166:H28]HDQ6827435.1 transcriptional regulator [Escherichia coli O128:H2]EEC8607050.1 transcriptional regulator [Escherichia coli]EED0570493.1 transcriptional regulator [Escherichia coli]EEQ2199990.1 transcriptional regulator [Escherichia coli]
MNEQTHHVPKDIERLKFIDAIDNGDKPGDAWCDSLADIVSHSVAELTRNGMEEADAFRIAKRVVAAIAFYAGGRSLYLPTGRSLFAALREYEIYYRWDNGEKLQTLRKEYAISETHIYDIIRRLRKKHANKITQD